MAIGRTSRVTAHPRRETPYSGEWIDQGWHKEAACAGADDRGEDLITPEDPGAFIAKYCRSCPVILDCAEEGLRIDSQHGEQIMGIWGGVHVTHSYSGRNKDVKALEAACATLRVSHARSEVA